MADYFWSIFAGLLFVLLLGFTEAGDAKSQRVQDAQYCKMVRDGVWPDYKSVYLQMCRDGDLRPQ